MSQMGEALIRGFVSSGVSTADKISASVRSIARASAMHRLGVTVFGNALEGGAADIAASNIVVLGVLTLPPPSVSASHAVLNSSLKPSKVAYPPAHGLYSAQVKPVYVRDVVRALAPHVEPRRHLIVSIAAGVKLDSIEELLPAQTRVVRQPLARALTWGPPCRRVECLARLLYILA